MVGIGIMYADVTGLKLGSLVWLPLARRLKNPDEMRIERIELELGLVEISFEQTSSRLRTVSTVLLERPSSTVSWGAHGSDRYVAGTTCSSP